MRGPSKLRAALVTLAIALLGCAESDRTGALAEPCSESGACDEGLVCERGVCALPAIAQDASAPREDASVVEEHDAGTPVDASGWDATLVPPEPPPPPRDTGPRLPPPPLRSHTAEPGFFDAALDWERHRLFLSQGASGRVEVIDLVTGARGIVNTGHIAEHMHFDPHRDEIAIALPVRLHSSYWWDDEQEGYVTTIDPAALTVREPIYVEIDPWDVIADGYGRIHVSSGSGQHTISATIDLVQGQSRVLTDSFGLYERTSLELHPSGDHAYGVGPHDATARLELGSVLAIQYRAPHDPSMPTACAAIRIDPRGRTIHTACGQVLVATDNPLTDMTPTGTLDTGWTDLVFHPSGDRLYLIDDDAPGIGVYDVATLTRVDTIDVEGRPVRLLAAPDYLVVLTPVLGGVPTTRVDVRSYDAR
ncbi:hypothetical protein [Sandaracinus amylolyticus]|uniref:hypothetical protein n=1 Tax=Sandaracinus amylolyticus TaxID=927083 RepID=UPI00146FF3D6|nr:hypothetical protein [Sandaracinus amylolyticus]